MQKFILNCLGFIGFTILFYLIAIFLWGTFAPSLFDSNVTYRRGSYGHMYSRVQEIKAYKDVDILFLGSSHAYRGFDTRIFRENGYKAFNLGSSRQTPLQSNLLLKRYLDDLNPKIVIYEVFPLGFTVDGVESSVDIIANDQNDALTLEMVLELNNIKSYNTYLYAILREYLGINKSFTESAVKGPDTYISGGFVEKKSNSLQMKKSYGQREIIFYDGQFEHFQEIISALKAKDIDVILITAPVTSVFYNQFTNFSSFDSIMQSQGTYWNFNNYNNVFADSIHFYGANHLNQTGVKLFNQMIIDSLNLD